MKLALQQKLYQYKLFWQVRSWLKLKAFYLSRFLYSQSQKVSSFKNSIAAIANMFRSSLVYFILPVLITGFTQFFEPPLRAWFVSSGWNILLDSDYATLVATVTSICGLFIGLYYTAVTSIGGAIYSKVPQSLRQLLLNERFGNTYLKYLVFVTSLGILLLSQYVLGYRANPLNVPLIAVLGGFAVFAFFQLGVRVLRLFEPTQFAGEICSSIATSVESVIPSSGNWDNIALQNHERKAVEHWLETLEALADIASSEKHLSGKVFVGFVTELTQLLRWYEIRKDKIPRNSEWFKYSYKHPDWYQTSDIQTSIAHQTGSILNPIKEPELRWLENELSKILFSCLKVNLENQNYSIATTTVSYIELYVKTISSKGDLRWALEVIKQTSSVSESHINSVCQTSSDQSIELIGLCDAIATLPIELHLSFVKQLTQRSGDKISGLIKRNNWKNKNYVYEEKLSEVTINRLEWLKERVFFELDVEGKVVTPDWYLINETCKAEASSFVENIDLIIDEIGEIYTVWVTKLISSKRYWLASTCSVREKEFWQKVAYQLDAVERYWCSLSKFQKNDSQWPSFKVDRLSNMSKDKKAVIEDHRATLLLGLLNHKRPDNFPDFPGAFLHSQGEAIFDALVTNDSAKVYKVFLTYFWASFYKFSELLPKDFDELWKVENAAKIASSALIDLLDLSGYGLVLSRYFKNVDLTTFITGIWNKYLDEQTSRTAQLIATVNMFDSAFEIAHRSEHRLYWESCVNNKLTSEIEAKKLPARGFHYTNEFIRLHEDPLVRIFAEEDIGIGHKGIDVLVSEILLPRLKDPENEIKNFRRDLRDELAREIVRYRSFKEGEKNEE